MNSVVCQKEYLEALVRAFGLRYSRPPHTIYPVVYGIGQPMYTIVGALAHVALDYKNLGSIENYNKPTWDAWTAMGITT